MKNTAKKIIALVMAVCMLATCALAAVPGNIDVTATAKEKSSGSYDVSYKASLVMPDELATAAASTFPDERLFEMTFVCTLEDALSAQLGTVAKDDFTFDGENVFKFKSITTTSDGLQIRYNLDPALKTKWASYTTAELKNAFKAKMTMTANKTATAAQIDTALAESDPVDIYAEVTIEGEFGSFDYDSGFIAAKGTAELDIVKKGEEPSGGNGGLSGGSEETKKYDITVVNLSDKGSVTTSRKEAGKGTVITITSTAEDGYSIKSLTVKTAEGTDVAVIKKSSTTYTFTMPAADVTVTSDFKAAIADPKDTGVGDILNTDDHIAYMFGYPEGDFRPQGNITRAEVCQMFYNLMKNKEVTEKAPFSDVDQNQWYATAVNKLSEMKIINGVGNNKFEPNRAITRAEFATIVARFVTPTKNAFDFVDVTTDHWAYAYVSTAAGYGWINGVGDNKFEPSRNILRAEAATLVNHMLGRIADKEAIDAGRAKVWPDVSSSYWGRYEVAETTTEHSYSFNDDRTKETWID